MPVTMYGRVAVCPVFGILSQRVGMLEEASGGVSCEKLGATLDSLVADKTVKCVVLAIDSPGGSVFGIQELGDRIRGYRGQKKVVAVADSMAASAAYWVGSQCEYLYLTPGGQVGSVGVLAAHLDVSEMEKLAGVKTSIVTAGKYKAEMASETPLSDDARAELQSKVDYYYRLFVEAVAKGRNTTAARVKADYGQGRMMTGEQAKTAGAVDGIYTLAQVLKRYGADSGDKEAPTSPAWTAARARAVEVQ
jgi:signal peptide peptidase SppA